MKATRETNGNKSLPNLPLHKFLGVAVRFVLALLCSRLYGGSTLMWFVGLWLVWNPLTSILRFLCGCLTYLLAFTLIVAFVVWLLTL